MSLYNFGIPAKQMVQSQLRELLDRLEDDTIVVSEVEWSTKQVTDQFEKKSFSFVYHERTKA